MTTLLMLVVALVYAYCHVEFNEALSWPDATVLAGWREYMSIGVPATGILLAEYWGYGCFTFIAVYLGEEAQHNMIISTHISALINTACLGIQ